MGITGVSFNTWTVGAGSVGVFGGGASPHAAKAMVSITMAHLPGNPVFMCHFSGQR
jgi:hypothetical protein